MNLLFKSNNYPDWGKDYFNNMWTTVSLCIPLVLQMCRIFYYLMVIVGIILASLVPKCSIIRYFRCHLGFCDIWRCHFDFFDIFGILAYWDSKVDIIRDQRFLSFGIFALSWCLLLGFHDAKMSKIPKKICQNQKRIESWLFTFNASSKL